MSDTKTPSVLITGASGFVGSFIVQCALEQGFEVWAAVRKGSSRDYLKDPRIHFFYLDLSSDDRLEESLEEHRQYYGAWDYVIHAAGATKCRTKSDFYRTNTDGTLRLARLLVKTSCLAGRFVFISSLSIMGALREKGTRRQDSPWLYQPILDTDAPVPNTVYGKSKWKAEQGLRDIEGLNYVVLRPTGVYGPRDKDYFLMAKSIAQHVDFAVGYRRQEITFIYVQDLAEAAISALTKGEKGKAYFLTDGEVYTSRTFSDLLQQEMGVRRVLHITAPVWVLYLVSVVAETFAAWRKKTSTLNTDKYRIMKQRNWQCDISAAQRDLDFAPKFNLKRGAKAAVAWYKQEKWI